MYVSDYPGSHDFDLLRSLVLEDGTVLRSLLPGRPTRDCLFRDVLRDDESLLKVRTLALLWAWPGPCSNCPARWVCTNCVVGILFVELCRFIKSEESA